MSDLETNSDGQSQLAVGDTATTPPRPFAKAPALEAAASTKDDTTVPTPSTSAAPAPAATDAAVPPVVTP